MKKLLLFFFILFNFELLSQEEEISSFELGILGGINFSSFSSNGPSLIVDGKINLIENLNLKLSLGYSRSYVTDSYNVKTYNAINIQGTEEYQTVFYNVLKKGYDIIPLSIGFQYNLLNNIFSPYLLVEFGHNSIGTKIYTSKVYYMGGYETHEDLPADYKTKHIEDKINSSYRLGFGFGTTYKVLSTIDLDIRYLYQIDTKIINSHLFLVGFSF